MGLLCERMVGHSYYYVNADQGIGRGPSLAPNWLFVNFGVAYPVNCRLTYLLGFLVFAHATVSHLEGHKPQQQLVSTK